jgi:hypothetical protein
MKQQARLRGILIQMSCRFSTDVVNQLKPEDCVPPVSCSRVVRGHCSWRAVFVAGVAIVRRPSFWASAIVASFLLLVTAGRAAAQIATESSSPPKNTIEGQLVLTLPAALVTGMSAGVGAAFTRVATRGGLLAWGAYASWSTATEYSLTDTIRNDDIRLRLCGQIQHAVGRGLFGLRVGVGGTLVYENSTRDQAARAGLSGGQAESTSWAMLPAADIEGVVVLRIWDSWGMSVSGGPTLHGLHSGVRAGWTSGLGVTWQH